MGIPKIVVVIDKTNQNRSCNTRESLASSACAVRSEYSFLGNTPFSWEPLVRISENFAGIGLLQKNPEN